jgi:MFS transporter, MHS family, shikimate and dehydroshikimate transport protein
MQQTHKQTSVVSVALASFIGTCIEWYDFYLYGTAAALVFGPLFFSPKLSPLTAQLLAFATFWIGFAARPVGGIVFGHFGDRLGRKTILILTLLIMGSATFLVGCLPTFRQVGLLAPLLLVILRFVQGFAVGGEWGGAVLMATEHSPQGRRGFYGSWPQMGAPIGLLFSSLIFSSLSSTLSHQAFLTIGWRIPFLLSSLLIIVGIVIRLHIAETPAFEHMKAAQTIVRVPLFHVLRTNLKTVLLAIGALFVLYGSFYIFATFIITYGHALKIANTTILNGIICGAIAAAITIPLAATLSDTIGRRPIYLIGAVFLALIAFPAFWLINTRVPLLIDLALILSIGGNGLLLGPQAAFFSELFDAHVRYSGASFSYQVASMLAGGLTPLLATLLLARFHNAFWPIALYLIGLALVTLICTSLLRETCHGKSSVETVLAEATIVRARR